MIIRPGMLKYWFNWPLESLPIRRSTLCMLSPIVNYRFHPILVSSRRKNPGLCRSPIFCGSRQTIRLPYWNWSWRSVWKNCWKICIMCLWNVSLSKNASIKTSSLKKAKPWSWLSLMYTGYSLSYRNSTGRWPMTMWKNCWRSRWNESWSLALKKPIIISGVWMKRLLWWNIISNTSFLILSLIMNG